MDTKPPKVGQLYTYHGIRCEIVRVYDFGTMDVVSLCGCGAWRVTGLPWIKANQDERIKSND